MSETEEGLRPLVDSLAGSWQSSLTSSSHAFARAARLELQVAHGRLLLGATAAEAPDGKPNLSLNVRLKAAEPGLFGRLIVGEFSSYIPDAKPPRAVGKVALLLGAGNVWTGYAYFTHRGAPAVASLQLVPIVHSVERSDPVAAAEETD